MQLTAQRTTAPKRKAWTASEDELIRSSILAHGCKWRAIAAQLPGRSVDAVRWRWGRVEEAQAPGRRTDQ